MRLLMISDVYFPRVNGVSTSIQTTRHALEQLGHEVTLVAPAYPLPHADDERIARVSGRRVLLDPEDRLMRWGELMRLGRSLASRRFDLVHIHTPFVSHYAALRLAREAGLPVVETYHTFFEQYLEHYIPFLPGPLLRLAARRLTVSQGNAVDTLISPSLAMRDQLLRYGVRTPIEVIPTGIDLEAWRAPQAPDPRPALGMNADQPMLLFVGRLAFEKNIEFLLEMFAHIASRRPEARLVLAGEGPAEARLRQRAADLGLGQHVLFVGYLPRDGALQALYRAANAFVFASATETQGLVLIEALALGTPVVALAEMGTRDIVREGEGCLVAPHDASGFAARVLELLAHPHHAASLAARAMVAAEAWREDRVAGRLVDLYARVIELKNERAARALSEDAREAG
ncbi:MAG TPA: glycosyltransferase family 4 protein [Chromatiales bacterium]|nr:glycosyltransferase family 4 protein [Chromatiales bacterium]